MTSNIVTRLITAAIFIPLFFFLFSNIYSLFITNLLAGYFGVYEGVAIRNGILAHVYQDKYSKHLIDELYRSETVILVLLLCEFIFMFSDWPFALGFVLPFSLLLILRTVSFVRYCNNENSPQPEKKEDQKNTELTRFNILFTVIGFELIYFVIFHYPLRFTLI